MTALRLDYCPKATSQYVIPCFFPSRILEEKGSHKSHEQQTWTFRLITSERPNDIPIA